MSHTRHNKSASGDPRRSPVAAKSGGGKSTKTLSSKGKNPTSKSSTGKAVSNGVHEVKGTSVGNGFAASLPNRKSTSSAKEEQEIVKMNLLTLQKMDKSVSSILETVPHVVLYEFKTTENVWVSWKFIFPIGMLVLLLSSLFRRERLLKEPCLYTTGGL